MDLQNDTTVQYEDWVPEDKATGQKADFKMSKPVPFPTFFAKLKKYFHEVLLPHHDLAC